MAYMKQPPGGGVSPAIALDQGLAFGEDANAFFTTAESLAQLQAIDASSQRFDRSAGRFAAAEAGFFGVNTIGGPRG